MNTTINNGMPMFPQAPAGQASATAQGTAGAAGNDASRAATASGDNVKLTDSARALQEAARTDDSAAIDSKKVEQARQALANGTYQVNPGRIADRMLALDAQIAGTAGTGKA
jgi:negative regulator of flagellin synthesis FlgM